MEFNEEKFRELILYLATQCSDDVYWGATKLNKQLFFCDFLAYKMTGQAITGADYMALEYGPAPRRMRPIRAQMVQENEIILERRAHQHRIIPQRSANMELFSNQERKLIDSVMDRLRNSTWDEVSDLSHKFVGWQAAIAEGEATGNHVSIPYGTVFAKRPTLSEQELQDALVMAEQHEWPI